MKKLPKMLPDAWPIFFRNRLPTPIQAEAIPQIVRGESAILCSPTASGKTEAVVAPLYQRHVSFRREKLSVVYIAPTKALVNDLYFRLEGYLGGKSASAIGRYTGDHHDFKDPDGLFLLLSTPEALDSLQLTRSELLTSVRAIVVDEIHLLHGSPRGQQLRHVMRRLEACCDQPKIQKDNFHTIGMTATIDEIEDVKALWIDDNAISIHTGDPRKIDMTYLDVSTDSRDKEELAYEKAAAIAGWISDYNPTKVLIFGNSRNATHALAAHLHELLQESRWPVFWHVGILNTTERVRIEESMKDGRFGICVATSTLEVGIDIGDIDVIVLADPPFTINAFLQRIGRGNRKSDTCHVLSVFTNEYERTIFLAMHQCACLGSLEDIHEYDRPSVAFQQLLSLAWYGIRSENPLKTTNILNRTGSDDLNHVLDDMIETGAIRDIGGVLIPNDEFMDHGDKRKIHTNIIGPLKLPMIDHDSGEILGYTSPESFENDKVIYIKGKMKKLVQGGNGEIYIESLKDKEKLHLAKLPSMRMRRGLSRRLVWAIADLQGLDPRYWVRDQNSLMTFGGAEFNLLLKNVLKKSGITSRISHNDFGIEGLSASISVNPDMIYKMAEEEVRQTGGIQPEDAFSFCNATRYFSKLSRKMQIREAANSVPFKSFFRWLQECQNEIIEENA